MSAYTLPLTCMDCGSDLDLGHGVSHDLDHTSASASCPCGARWTIDARLHRDPTPRTRDEIHAARIDRAATAAASSGREVGP